MIVRDSDKCLSGGLSARTTCAPNAWKVAVNLDAGYADSDLYVTMIVAQRFQVARRQLRNYDDSALNRLRIFPHMASIDHYLSRA
jgi:hypothetical protein